MKQDYMVYAGRMWILSQAHLYSSVKTGEWSYCRFTMRGLRLQWGEERSGGWFEGFSSALLECCNYQVLFLLGLMLSHSAPVAHDTAFLATDSSASVFYGAVFSLLRTLLAV